MDHAIFLTSFEGGKEMCSLDFCTYKQLGDHITSNVISVVESTMYTFIYKEENEHMHIDLNIFVLVCY